jgi:hypothetical protein
MARPDAAAFRASVAPDEYPNTAADPPASPITASRSAISRSTEYGRVSPLSPRPRRSTLNVVKRSCSATASGSVVERVLNAPATIKIAGPSPSRS